MTARAELGPQWQACLELAWVAYGRNTTPVGAIVVDGTEKTVAEGTNARYDASAGGALTGSHLAHAEVIALAELSAATGYPDHTLYTSLEPCLLCVGAAVMSSVGHVRWAGVDPYGGATGLPREGNAHLRRGKTTFTGPSEGVFGMFAAALVVESYLRRKPAGHVVAAYREASPEIVTAAQALTEIGLYRAAAEGAPVAAGYDRAVSTLLGRINLRPG